MKWKKKIKTKVKKRDNDAGREFGGGSALLDLAVVMSDERDFPAYHASVWRGFGRLALEEPPRSGLCAYEVLPPPSSTPKESFKANVCRLQARFFTKHLGVL